MPLCTNIRAFLLQIDRMADIIAELIQMAYVLTYRF